MLIVGAGPSGLVLARVLADSGVPFRIIDRKAGPVRESRAAIVHVRTLELLERAESVNVEWCTELRELAGHTAVLRQQDGSTERVEARWIVGADGASSRVRHALGLGFGGTTYGQAGLLADVTLDGELPRAGHLRLTLTRGGFVGIMDLGNGRYRVFGAVPPGLAARSDGGEVSHDAYAEVGAAEIQRWFDEVFLLRARITGT